MSFCICIKLCQIFLLTAVIIIFVYLKVTGSVKLIAIHLVKYSDLLTKAHALSI